MKSCTKCGVSKPVSDFGPNTSSPDGFRSQCKKCRNRLTKERRVQEREQNPETFRKREQAYQRTYYKKNPGLSVERHRKKKYGITAEQFASLLTEQKNCCKICCQEFRNARDTHTDHCHKTKAVRGLLCAKCNLALGLFSDSENCLTRAVAYLKGAL